MDLLHRLALLIRRPCVSLRKCRDGKSRRHHANNFSAFIFCRSSIVKLLHQKSMELYHKGGKAASQKETKYINEFFDFKVNVSRLW
jgi:hypothetical protein